MLAGEEEGHDERALTDVEMIIAANHLRISLQNTLKSDREMHRNPHTKIHRGSLTANNPQFCEHKALPKPAQVSARGGPTS